VGEAAAGQVQVERPPSWRAFSLVARDRSGQAIDAVTGRGALKATRASDCRGGFGESWAPRAEDQMLLR